ncbi:MAG: peptidoglycan-binding protein [Candidatus Gastranaerophilales bacterium]|nr:peptidoglycan-binding protein [Candidatus Gastranaerophilales bacterium]
MKISQNGIDLIKQFEGCRLDAYKCPAGVWTIGYGHTAGVEQGQKISAAQAEAYLRADLEKYEKKVDKYSKYGWNQNEFDAMVSFAYNVGSIDQLTAGGTRTRTVIAEKMLQYNKGGGKVLSGLTRRRQAERKLFLQSCTGATTEDGISSTSRATVRQGSRGADVTYLQQRLVSLGYSLGAVDGIFGSKTRTAVMAFQRDHKLTVDGIVGPKTWAALKD